jgi:hypothetical protein
MRIYKNLSLIVAGFVLGATLLANAGAAQAAPPPAHKYDDYSKCDTVFLIAGETHHGLGGIFIVSVSNNDVPLVLDQQSKGKPNKDSQEGERDYWYFAETYVISATRVNGELAPRPNLFGKALGWRFSYPADCELKV